MIAYRAETAMANILGRTMKKLDERRSLLLKTLRTLIGLGFTAVLADKNLLHIYQPLLSKFLNAQDKDFILHFRANRGIAQSLANMIHIATICFYTLKFPRYYTSFF